MRGKLTANLPAFVAATTILTLALRVDAQSESLSELRHVVPADAIAVIEMERFAQRLGEIQRSPVVVGLNKLPMVQVWLQSEEGRRFLSDRAQTEKTLGATWSELTKHLFDRSVLVAVFPPNRAGEPAPVLALTVADDRGWLENLIQTVNRAEGANLRLDARKRQGIAYTVRFDSAQGARPRDSYAILNETTLVWSNSPETLEAAIDRHAASQAQANGDPRRESMAKRLNPQAVVRFYLDPKTLSRALGLPTDWSVRTSALEYLGGSLDWRNGPILQVEATLNPQQIHAELRRWARRVEESSLDPMLERVPATALMVCAAKVDFGSLLELSMQAFDPDARERGEQALQALRGLMLDQDPRTEVLPKLGPAAVLILEPPRPQAKNLNPAVPGQTPMFSWTAVLATNNRDGQLAKGLENAARTTTALVALDSNKAKSAPPRLSSQTLNGVQVSEWIHPEFTLSFGFGADRIVFADQANLVAQALQPQATSTVPRLMQSRRSFFRDADAFVYLDLTAGREWLESRRAEIAPPDDPKAAEDFEQAVSLIGLLQTAFASARVAPDASEAGVTIGLIGRE